jgi:hypothetical protein
MSAISETRWFEWGDTLAVIVGHHAWSVQPRNGGWRAVNAAEVGWDGRPLTEATARSAFANTLAQFGEPPNG